MTENAYCISTNQLYLTLAKMFLCSTNTISTLSWIYFIRKQNRNSMSTCGTWITLKTIQSWGDFEWAFGTKAFVSSESKEEAWHDKRATDIPKPKEIILEILWWKRYIGYLSYFISSFHSYVYCIFLIAFSTSFPL